MKLTHPAQLDALPEGAVVADDYGETWDKVGGGWRWSAADVQPAAGVIGGEAGVYLLEATATTAADLDRLLPGAIVLGECGRSWRRIGDDWATYALGWRDNAELVTLHGPLSILYPGDPTEES